MSSSAPVYVIVLNTRLLKIRITDMYIVTSQQHRSEEDMRYDS